MKSKSVDCGPTLTGCFIHIKEIKTTRLMAFLCYECPDIERTNICVLQEKKNIQLYKILLINIRKFSPHIHFKDIKLH